MASIYEVINKQISSWIDEATSNRDFALSHNIDEKTVRRIRNGDIEITLKSLEKICEARNMKLSEFFKEINK